MSIDRALLGRYLRQLADLGVNEIAFDGMTAKQAVQALTSPGSAAGSARAAAVTAGSASAPPVTNTPPSTVPAASSPAADRLAALSNAAAVCTLCGLHAGRSTVVFGEGSATADVVVVGEAPGQEEDRTGRPFVGRAGKLLDLMLASAGFPRAEVYICNVLKCRPPNNRNPLPEEVSPCTTNFLHGQLEAIAPRVLLAVGKFAAQALLDSQESIGRLRGTVHSYRGTPLVVTYHPAYLLRSPQMTRVAWQDFQLVRRVLDEQA
ncbi:MAG TPA: uracil-DNA glycosylase [Longimicrobiales bacterium]|nr:uracil-DNA glycosylase [Longimicrobiales bacterium]